MKSIPQMLLMTTCLLLLFSACGGAPPVENSPGSQGQDLTPGAPTELLPATDPPASSDPTSTPAAIESTLSEADILEVVRTSLTAYPWRLNQSVVAKETGQTSTTLTEAQSSMRGYNQSVQMVGGETITIETVLIDATVYLKITGSGVAETYGLVDGQWTEIAADSPLSQFVDRGAIDPAKIAEIFATDFASMPKEGGAGELLFASVGAEQVNGVATTIYEAKGETFTYRWWIAGDGRFYKTTVDLPQATRTMLMEYDPGITIEEPIP